MNFLLIVIFAGASGLAIPTANHDACEAAKAEYLQADNTQAFCIIQADPGTEFITPEDFNA